MLSTRQCPALLLAGVCLFLMPAVSVAQSSSEAQSSKPKVPAEARKMLNKQVGWDEAKASEKNPNGLHLHFSKIEANGLANASSGVHEVRYRVYMPGIPTSGHYVLGMWKIGSDMDIVYNKVFVNAKGLLMTHAPRVEQMNKSVVPMGEEINVTIQAARGEPVRFVLATEDGKLVIPGTVVPYPIVATAGDCRLEGRLALPDGQAVLIYADGLPPGTDVPLESISEGANEPTNLHVDSHGHAATVDLPFVEGKPNGVLKVALKTEGCSLKIDIPWGEGSYRLQ